MNKELPTTYNSMIYGAFSGVVAKSSMAPLDRLKIIFQTNNIKFTWHNLYIHSKTVITKEGGYYKLWKGNGVQMLRIAPNASISFTFQRYYKSLLLDKNGNLSTQKGYLVGLLTGLSSSAILYPIDTLRCRIATDISKKSTISIIQNNIKTQGVKSLYNGFIISTSSMMPYSSLLWGTFYYLNNKLQSHNNTLHKESHTLRAVAIASSVVFSQTIVYPFDVYRRRIQVQNRNSSQYINQIEILKTIIKEKSYFKGLSINFIKTPIVNTLAFTLFSILEEYDPLQNLYLR